MSRRIRELLDGMADKIAAAKERLDVAQRDRERWIAASDVADLANIAIRPFVGRIRSMLVQNLRENGIKRDSGRLEDGVRNAYVWCTVGKGGTVELRYGLRRGLDKDVYKYAQAIHSGSVRAPMKTMPLIDLPQRRVVGDSRRSVLGQKAKRSIKNSVLGKAKLSRRSASYLARSKNVAVGNLTRNKGKVDVAGMNVTNDTDKSARVGQVVVIKPKYFFQLSDAQVGTFIEEFSKRLEGMMRSRQAQKGDNHSGGNS